MSINYSRKEVKQLFKNQLSKRLEFMDSERKKLKLYSVICFICVVYLVFFLYVTTDYSTHGHIAALHKYAHLPPRFLMPAIFCSILFFIYFYYRMSLFRKKYKKKVVAPVIETFIRGAKYEAKKGLSESDYIESGLVSSSHNSFRSEDLVTFKYHGLDIQFSEVHSEYVSGGKNKTRRTAFRGFLLKSELPKKLRHKTIIVPDISESFFGGLVGRFIQKRNVFRKEELVILESSEFEKKYAVYASDQIEARKILTPKIMEKILNYNLKANQKIYLSFTQDKLYLAIPTRHNYFEPRIWDHTRFSDIIRMVRMLSVITEFLDVFAEDLKDSYHEPAGNGRTH